VILSIEKDTFKRSIMNVYTNKCPALAQQDFGLTR